jgi:hypothetical protein
MQKVYTEVDAILTSLLLMKKSVLIHLPLSLSFAPMKKDYIPKNISLRCSLLSASSLLPSKEMRPSSMT